MNVKILILITQRVVEVNRKQFINLSFVYLFFSDHFQNSRAVPLCHGPLLSEQCYNETKTTHGFQNYLTFITLFANSVDNKLSVLFLFFLRKLKKALQA